ncbi:aminomethyl-transferring glycine dehydrogenase subunit GcvPA [Acuticoccus sp. I52.16.1]|uniref:aminomethyl-transferring glycine dehydrogenase subunit GcvPA n=1 Tax=Acuticoccus sp. I52.16.1 TaxID=2928472 RepID=UPI001FD0DA9E|nr:aminomethyl-transferring glycine dehydrogenase subunit GcvPA [Acuticoccus sp. I52.16.1]UOM34772.1 aminomethyl-transferring glycine dehydrogenase subunit GcvPA [Acuticoccus sp. I52.16.1]
MRYHPLTADDRALMLKKIGVGAIDDLFVDVPAGKLFTEPMNLPAGQSEIAVERALSAMARKNHAAGDGPFFLGAGAYRHHVPATVDHLIQRSEFLTSYTPYQAEISQGTLQVLFEFQTQVARLTGMEVANASMYDGSTAAAEAVMMAARLTKRGKAVVSGGVHPQYRDVIATVATGVEIDALPSDPTAGEDILARIDKDVACVVVQSPSFYGHLIDLAPIAEAAHEAGALLVSVFTEPVALGAIEPPGAQGADIVVGEGQGIGNPLTFGGPYVGLFATQKKHVRQMPGRLSGETVDADGKRGYALTLSTREQHIRRDKATSNICTNSGLCALAFTIHMTLLGEKGLTRLAALNHERACATADALTAAGVEVLNETFFNEFTVRVPGDAAAVVERAAGEGIIAGLPVSRLDAAAPGDLIVVAATELTTDEDIAALAGALGA